MKKKIYDHGKDVRKLEDLWQKDTKPIAVFIGGYPPPTGHYFYCTTNHGKNQDCSKVGSSPFSASIYSVARQTGIIIDDTRKCLRLHALSEYYCVVDFFTCMDEAEDFLKRTSQSRIIRKNGNHEIESCFRKIEQLAHRAKRIGLVLEVISAFPRKQEHQVCLKAWNVLEERIEKEMNGQVILTMTNSIPYYEGKKKWIKEVLPHLRCQYFAYGSNMNSKRMKERGVKILETRHATLFSHSLRFNKKKEGSQGIGYANISQDRDSYVEGILYEISKIDLLKLDRCEGFPLHYGRREIKVRLDDGSEVMSFVYFAQRWMIAEDLLPEKEYMKHLLSAGDLLSAKWIRYLKSIKTY
jgi:gamma-glutamylcyclotransferase (GGCT)/AIG2-like uncharacterized protein YtfP